MSSRICRPGDSEVRSIEWRVCGAAPVNTHAPRASQPSAELPPVHNREAETAAHQRGYREGAAAGEAAARQQAQARVESAIAQLGAVAQELAGLRRKLRGEAEEDVVKLAMAIARRILHRELTSDPEALLGLVKAAFQKSNARETHRLRLSPQDAELVREHRALLNLPPAVEITADGGLARGSAIFETSRGDLNASLDTQLGEIERGLTDVMRKRNQ